MRTSALLFALSMVGIILGVRFAPYEPAHKLARAVNLSHPPSSMATIA